MTISFLFFIFPLFRIPYAIAMLPLSFEPLISEPLAIWTLINCTFAMNSIAMILWTFDLNLCHLIWYIWFDTFDMTHLIWYNWNGIWYELFDLNLWYDMLSDPPVWYYEPICYTSHGGSMSLSLMHQWLDSRVGEWWPIPSHYLICFGDEVFGQWGVWMHPRFVICFEGFIMIIYIFGDWWCVRYTSFTFWELITPLVTWGLPSYYIWYSEVSPPNMMVTMLQDMIWFVWAQVWLLTFHTLWYSFVYAFCIPNVPYYILCFLSITSFVYISVHWAF